MTRTLTASATATTVPQPLPAARDARVGAAYGIGAYVFWGISPVYFKVIAAVPAAEVLAHRIIWSVLLLVVLVAVRREWAAIRAALVDRRRLLTLLCTGVLVGGNWYGFIWSIENHQLMQASLGYFINPLVSVLLGFVFLRERLRVGQWCSVAAATVAVVYLTHAEHTLPWLGLYLAVTFGLYGLLRKKIDVASHIGLTVETAFLLPVALTYLVYLMAVGSAAFTRVSVMLDLELFAAGAITTTPLLLFNAAARRLRLATLGFLQYLAPTGHFLLALCFGEPMSHARWVAFIVIWGALVLYSVDTARHARRPRAIVPAIE